MTNGIIDVTGITAHGWIRDNTAESFSSGWGIFIQDIQSGALLGTNNVQIMNNRIVASGTGGCIEILHSATNAVTMNSFDILDTNCSVGASSGNSVLLQNTASGNTLLRQINVQNLYINGTPAAQNAFVINGVQQLSLRNITCAGGSSAICVSIASNTNNSLIVVDNVIQYSGNNALNDVANSITIPGNIQHYELPGTSYLPTVSYLKTSGLLPAGSATGCGTGCAVTPTPGSTNNGGILQVVAGTTPSSSGTLTLTFNVTQTNFGSNTPSCVFTLHNTTGAWNARASLIISSPSVTSIVTNWDNNSVNLVAASQYNIHYMCFAH